MHYLRVVLNWKKGGRRVEYHPMPHGVNLEYVQFWLKTHLKSKAYRVEKWEVCRETLL